MVVASGGDPMLYEGLRDDIVVRSCFAMYLETALDGR